MLLFLALWGALVNAKAFTADSGPPKPVAAEVTKRHLLHQHHEKLGSHTTHHGPAPTHWPQTHGQDKHRHLRKFSQTPAHQLIGAMRGVVDQPAFMNYVFAHLGFSLYYSEAGPSYYIELKRLIKRYESMVPEHKKNRKHKVSLLSLSSIPLRLSI